MMIRSQDKRVLAPLGEVRIFNSSTDKTSFILQASPSGRGYIELGKYKSITRCLEILDEIQREFQYSNHYSGSGINSENCQSWSYGVYQMPEE